MAEIEAEGESSEYLEKSACSYPWAYPPKKVENGSRRENHERADIPKPEARFTLVSQPADRSNRRCESAGSEKNGNGEQLISAIQRDSSYQYSHCCVAEVHPEHGGSNPELHWESRSRGPNPVESWKNRTEKNTTPNKPVEKPGIVWIRNRSGEWESEVDADEGIDEPKVEINFSVIDQAECGQNTDLVLLPGRAIFYL